MLADTPYGGDENVQAAETRGVELVAPISGCEPEIDPAALTLDDFAGGAWGRGGMGSGGHGVGGAWGRGGMGSGGHGVGGAWVGGAWGRGGMGSGGHGVGGAWGRGGMGSGGHGVGGAWGRGGMGSGGHGVGGAWGQTEFQVNLKLGLTPRRRTPRRRTPRRRGPSHLFAGKRGIPRAKTVENGSLLTPAVLAGQQIDPAGQKTSGHSTNSSLVFLGSVGSIVSRRRVSASGTSVANAATIGSMSSLSALVGRLD